MSHLRPCFAPSLPEDSPAQHACGCDQREKTVTQKFRHEKKATQNKQDCHTPSGLWTRDPSSAPNVAAQLAGPIAQPAGGMRHAPEHVEPRSALQGLGPNWRRWPEGAACAPKGMVDTQRPS